MSLLSNPKGVWALIFTHKSSYKDVVTPKKFHFFNFAIGIFPDLSPITTGRVRTRPAVDTPSCEGGALKSSPSVFTRAWDLLAVNPGRIKKWSVYSLDQDVRIMIQLRQPRIGRGVWILSLTPESG